MKSPFDLSGGALAGPRTVIDDLERDPGPSTPVADAALEERLVQAMVGSKGRDEAPAETCRRFSLQVPGQSGLSPRHAGSGRVHRSAG